MATTPPPKLVRCPACGRTNRVPAAAAGKPRCGSCTAFLAWIAEAGDADFTGIAEQASVPVLVDFWAAWCAPCRTLSPALEQLATEKAGQLKLVKVDIDRAPRLAQRFSIHAVPTLLLLHYGKVIARHSGAAPLPVLRDWLGDALTRIPSASQPGGYR